MPPGIRKLVNPPSEEQTQDLTRRTGDLAIYRYYFSYIGFQDGLLLLSVLAVCVFALKFPRESILHVLSRAYPICAGANIDRALIYE